ncbi:MAG TPA: hypothetical protein VF160_01965 [Candidatus Dormibacteraeota bacterium]
MTPPAQAATGTLDVVGQTDLGARGLNAGLALADHCAYVGSRGEGPVAIVDISDPAHPAPVGQLVGAAAITHREVRAYPDGHWLVVLDYALRGGGVDQLRFYRWGADCAQLTPAGSYDFGSRKPHEMYLWRDTLHGRILLYVTMFGGGAGDLQVIDASDPAAPRLLATAGGLPGPLHSIALDADGRRAYLSDWTGGLYLADTSEFADAAPSPQLHLLTASAGAYRTPPGNVHSAVPVPGRQLVLTTDERYPDTGGCPYGTAHLVDVSDPAHPRPTATLAVAENDPGVCPGAAPGTYTSHNPTLTANLALITWYSGGLQVFDTSDAAHPVALAQLRPAGVQAHAGDPELGSTATMTWSYPIIRDGLIYVADINQGLLVLRYHGPHEEEISGLAFEEGNSNLTQALPAPKPGPTASKSASPARMAPYEVMSEPSPIPLMILLVAALLAAGGVLWVHRHR